MLKPLVVKEIKDLIRDPRIWIPFIIGALIMPIMALVIQFPMKSVFEEAVKGYLKVGVICLDKGSEGAKLLSYLESKKNESRLIIYKIDFSAEELSSNTFRKIVDHIKQQKLDLELILVIPPDFSEKVVKKERVKLYCLNIVKEVTIFGGSAAKTGRIQPLIERYLGEKYAAGAQAPYDVLVNPVTEQSVSYLEGKDILIAGSPFMLITSLGFASFFMPLILMIIAVTVIQLSATSMAVENEEKTLETLLTFPISPMEILLSKLLGSFIVSVIGSLLNILGYIAYMYIFASAFTVSETSEFETGFFSFSNVMISTQDLAFITISMIATIFFTATLGLIIGAFSSDVRIAGTLVGPLSMAVFIPGYLVAFAPLKMFSPAVKVALYCIPLTQPIIMVKQAMISRLPPETPVYLAVSILCSLVLLYVTARVFSLETLSNIQWKLKRLRKRKRREETE